MSDYAFNIAWSADDDEYVATCPAFPGLSGLGKTEEEALSEGKKALGIFVNLMNGKGLPLPEPTKPPTIEEMLGLVKDFTGGKSLKVYIEEIDEDV